jgi:hypothetical protein
MLKVHFNELVANFYISKSEEKGSLSVSPLVRHKKNNVVCYANKT